MTREEAAIDYCLFIGNTSLDEVDAFKAGAEWEHKRLVEKACEWLKEQNKTCMFELEMILGRKFIEEFCKAIEE